MLFDLDSLCQNGRELGFDCRREGDRVVVLFSCGSQLFFSNEDQKDTMTGFERGLWHSHGSIQLTTGESSYVALNGVETLYGIALGEILILDEYSGGVLTDRMLTHRRNEVDISFLEAGGEVRVRCAAIESRE